MNCTFIQVLQYLLDDVSEFLSTKFIEIRGDKEIAEDKGCTFALKAFIDYLFEREKENFRARRKDNENSVTLTTIHQVTIPLDYFFLELSSIVMQIQSHLTCRQKV